jgi:copper chaperone CopZ
MNKIELKVENLKCGGCETTLHNAIMKLDGIITAKADAESSTVLVEYSGDSELIEKKIEEKLAQIGYPKKGTGNNFQKAKSYVSCAIGKMSEKA